MKLFIHNSLFICFVLLQMTVFAQSSSSTKTVKQATITKGDNFNPEEFQIVIGSQTFILGANGVISNGTATTSVSAADDYYYTSDLNYVEINDQLILLYEVTNDEEAYTIISSIDNQNLSLKWKLDYFDFNLTVGQIESGNLYVGGWECIYAIDINTGKLTWCTKEMDDRYRFHSFQSLTISDNKLNFTGENYATGTKAIKTIVLTKKDGAVIETK